MKLIKRNNPADNEDGKKWDAPTAEVLTTKLPNPGKWQMAKAYEEDDSAFRADTDSQATKK